MDNNVDDKLRKVTGLLDDQIERLIEFTSKLDELLNEYSGPVMDFEFWLGAALGYLMRYETKKVSKNIFENEEN